MEDTMSNKVLKDILLAQGELERYYDGAVPLNLWRALNARRNEGLSILLNRHSRCPTVVFGGLT